MEILLSIITVAYNNLDGIRYTIDSIDYDNLSIEHLVIDGNSNDGTRQFLESQDHNIRWISEPDKGIYDAMNKGLKMAKGKYVIFMNSDDGFYQKNVLPQIVNILRDKKPDVVFGETMFRDEQNNNVGVRTDITTRKLPEELDWKKCVDGMVVCHQSFIVKRVLAPQYIENNLAADFDWVLDCLKQSNICINAKMIIANYKLGGESQRRIMKSIKDRFLVFTKHFGLLRTIFIHINILLRAVLHRVKLLFSS